MNSPIMNEYRLYECKKRKGAPVYIAFVYGPYAGEIPAEKVLLNTFPCATPKDWSEKIIKRIDNKLASLQLLKNSNLPYLVFRSQSKDYVEGVIREEIELINKTYVQIVNI